MFDVNYFQLYYNTIMLNIYFLQHISKKYHQGMVCLVILFCNINKKRGGEGGLFKMLLCINMIPLVINYNSTMYFLYLSHLEKGPLD